MCGGFKLGSGKHRMKRGSARADPSPDACGEPGGAGQSTTEFQRRIQKARQERFREEKNTKLIPSIVTLS